MGRDILAYIDLDGYPIKITINLLEQLKAL